MGRLAAGLKPEPLTKRLTRYRMELELSGGHRLIVDIEKPANDALQEIRVHDEPVEEGKELTQKEAVTRALLHYAKVVRRRAG